jgi:hypothetical protein
MTLHEVHRPTLSPGVSLDHSRVKGIVLFSHIVSICSDTGKKGSGKISMQFAPVKA